MGAGTPVQEPAWLVSVDPTCAVPVIVGAARFTVGPVTSAVALSAEANPLALVAVTVTRMRYPASPAAMTYVLVVSPTMSAQLMPAESQRLHWYENVGRG